MALINEYGDLETLLERAEEIKQPKRRATLIDHAAQIRLSRQLVELDCATPLDFTLEDLEVRAPEPEILLGFLAEMEFRTLTKRIADQLDVEMPEINDTPANAPDAPNTALTHPKSPVAAPDVPTTASARHMCSTAPAVPATAPKRRKRTARHPSVPHLHCLRHGTQPSQEPPTAPELPTMAPSACRCRPT